MPSIAKKQSNNSSATMAGVALQARCSIGTVSGILNGKGSHSPATIARVMEAVRATGFIPRKKPSHQNTRSGRQFALYFPEDDAPGSARSTFLGISMTRGVEKAIAAERHHLLIAEAKSDGSVPSLIRKGQIDGMILRAANYPQPFLESLRSIPAVWAFGVHPPPLHMDLVSVDNVRLGILAAERFSETEIKEVRIIHRRNEDNLEILIRVLSCEHSLLQRGIAVSRLELDAFERSYCTKELLRGKRSGVFVPGHDDDVLKIRSMLEAKRFTPQTAFLGVAANYQSVLSDYPDTRLIRIDPEAVGRAATNQLLWRLQNLHAPPQTVLVRAVG